MSPLAYFRFEAPDGADTTDNADNAAERTGANQADRRRAELRRRTTDDDDNVEISGRDLRAGVGSGRDYSRVESMSRPGSSRRAAKVENDAPDGK